MKYNPYDSFEEKEMRRYQLVYLKHCKNETWEKIAEITNYAISTVKSYARKFFDLLEQAKELFGGRRKEKKIEQPRSLCYLIKFYDTNNNLLFSKIGTTTRNIETRIKEHLRYYKKDYDIGNYKLESVIDCGDIPEEGAESECRAKFIKRFPRAFLSKDRFFNKDLPVEDFNKYVLEYLA